MLNRIFQNHLIYSEGLPYPAGNSIIWFIAYKTAWIIYPNFCQFSDSQPSVMGFSLPACHHSIRIMMTPSFTLGTVNTPQPEKESNPRPPRWSLCPYSKHLLSLLRPQNEYQDPLGREHEGSPVGSSPRRF